MEKKRNIIDLTISSKSSTSSTRKKRKTKKTSSSSSSKQKKKSNNNMAIDLTTDSSRENELSEYQLEYFNEEFTHEKVDPLYNPHIVFQFFSRSQSKAPGKGVGETIPNNKMHDFDELAAIPNWRQKLSNFYVAPFTLDNHQWASVEHYYQGSKFKINNPQFYVSFAMDSGSEWSLDPAAAKGVGGKSGKYKGKQLRPRDVIVDPDFFPPPPPFANDRTARTYEEMYCAQLAKYTQNEDLANMLIATKNAKLMHSTRHTPVMFVETMLIREKLKNRALSLS